MSDKLRELREREHLCTYQILNNSIFKKIIHFTASFSHENAVILEFEFNLKVLGIVNLAPRSYRVTLTEVCSYLTVIMMITIVIIIIYVIVIVIINVIITIIMIIIDIVYHYHYFQKLINNS